MIMVTLGVCTCGHGGTLYDGRCCRCANASMLRQPAPRTVSELFAAHVAQLEADEIPAPLAQRFTLGHIWHDLALLAGEPVPAHIAAMLDEPAHTAPFLAQPVETHREPAFDFAD